MVVLQIAMGVQALVLGLLTVAGALRFWEVCLLAVILGLNNAFENSARQAFVREMVGPDELRNAVTLNSVMVNAARAVGPAIAGELIATVGTGWCFLINAASYLFVIAGLRLIDPSQLTPASRSPKMRGQLTEGFRYVARSPVLRDALIMMAVVGMLAYEFQVSLPLMAGKTFHGNSATYGYLTACMGAGAVVGGLVAASSRTHHPRRLATTALAFGAAIMLAALAPSILTEELALLVVGAVSVTFLSLGNAILQLEADPSMRGRVMSLWSVAFLGTTPVGGPIVGFVGGTLGARYGLGLGAVATIAAGAFGHMSLLRGRAPEEVADAAVVTDSPLGTEPLGDGLTASVAKRADPGASRPDRPQRVVPPPRTA